MTFYYGGRLLAAREYTATNFFVIYIAVINGAESAGSFFSFGPSELDSNHVPAILRSSNVIFNHVLQTYLMGVL
jgi:hypothetical protein